MEVIMRKYFKDICMWLSIFAIYIVLFVSRNEFDDLNYYVYALETEIAESADRVTVLERQIDELEKMDYYN